MKTNTFLTACFVSIVMYVSNVPASAGWLFKSPEEKLQEGVSKWLKANKQQIVEKYHLLATAKDVELQAIMLADKNLQETDKLENAVGYGIVFTIFWEGPVTKDGYLKLIAYYDFSVRTFTEVQVVQTNGVLNQDAAEGIGEILGAMFAK
jgi:hypothetical protein